ncbi:ATP-binding protein [Pedobacter sp. D749]|uniref:PAS domain-containing sensor histidine kinase n=1 Tax=Pedobacter sp. D749 TaxID=2856523 RepID=UPI001C595DE7|nr:ATP-binding protein [Pedobacter sp. D749]QXU43600.1 PAS domain-containing protein [Pedobacter sp. D749]
MNAEERPHDNNFSEELIIQALQSSPDPTAIYTGEEMIIRFANAGMLALWGKDISVIGKPLIQAIPELAGQPFLPILEQVWRSGISYSVTDAPARLIKNGMPTTDYFDYEYKALLSADNKTWCILNTAKEVTSRREYLERIQQKEEKEQALIEEMATTMEELTSTNEDLNISMKLLEESREHVKTIIEQAPVGIAVLQGPDHIIEMANTAILKTWGREGKEVIGQAHHTARPELEGQPVNMWLDNVYETGKPKINKEFLVKLRDESGLREAIVNSIYQPIISSGKVTGILVILEEITQQVLDRRKNEKDQQMLTLAIDAGELATFYYEPRNNLFSGNALLKSWFGLSAEEHLDLSLALNSIHDEDRERVTDAIKESLRDGSDGQYFIEYRINNPKEPAPRLVQARGKVFYDPNGKAATLNGTLRDITEQKKDEQRKDDFMGMVSHELKTPLTSLQAYLQVLQREANLTENTTQQNVLAKSIKQVRNMNSMINSFLNISRLDSGKMLIEKSKIDLPQLFAELEEEMLSSIHTHIIVFEPVQALTLYADREKISQVIHNLAGNAVKYSEMGTRITIACTAPDQNRLKLTVSDEGIGIAGEDQHLIFERYHRVQNPQIGSIAGFGIGLYLCREIIALHHGQISVEKSNSEGTTFSVELPMGN